jgi:CheY-like chemotaxis protein
MPRVLSVGQCALDHGSIGRHLRKTFGAETDAVATFPQALQTLREAGGFDLVLVNRVTDRDGTLGLDLIRAIKADPELASVPVILVSNYPDAQDEAEALGAMPGFGKAELSTSKARERLAAVFKSAMDV